MWKYQPFNPCDNGEVVNMVVIWARNIAFKISITTCRFLSEGTRGESVGKQCMQGFTWQSFEDRDVMSIYLVLVYIGVYYVELRVFIILHKSH